MTDQISQRLERLQVLEQTSSLRFLAAWAACQTVPRHVKWKYTSEHVRDNFDDPDLVHFLHQMRKEFSGVAGAALAIGLRVSPAKAHSLLACVASLNADSMLAAAQSFHHAAEWYKDVLETDDASIFWSHLQDKVDATFRGLGIELV